MRHLLKRSLAGLARRLRNDTIERFCCVFVVTEAVAHLANEERALLRHLLAIVLDECFARRLQVVHENRHRRRGNHAHVHVASNSRTATRYNLKSIGARDGYSTGSWACQFGRR